MLFLYTNIAARISREEKGATAVEYGIMVAFIAVAIIAAVTIFGTSLSTMFETMSCEIKGDTYVPAGATAAARCPAT